MDTGENDDIRLLQDYIAQCSNWVAGATTTSSAL
jgi:hypothetical protein